MVDIKLTLWKVVKGAVYVAVAGLAAVYGNSEWYLAIAPFLLGLENLVKHWGD